MTSNFHCILYKNDDLPGWFLACLEGNVEEVKLKCEKLWKHYRFVKEPKFETPTEDVCFYTPPAWMMHETNNWIYSTYLKRWFLPDEPSPKPLFDCYVAKKLEMTLFIDEDYNSISELKVKYIDSCCTSDNPRITIETVITIKTDKETYSINFWYNKWYNEFIDKFLNEICSNTFTSFSIDEYDMVKILVWNNNGICRVAIQSYNEWEVETKMLFEIGLNDLISEFYNLFSKLKCEYEKLESQVIACIDDNDRALIEKKLDELEEE